jgi:hypothetical protein
MISQTCRPPAAARDSYVTSAAAANWPFPAGLVAVDKVGENLYLLRFRLDTKRSRGSKFWLTFRSYRLICCWGC